MEPTATDRPMPCVFTVLTYPRGAHAMLGISSESSRLTMSEHAMQRQWEEARQLEREERENRQADFTASHIAASSSRRAARDSARPNGISPRGQSRPQSNAAPTAESIEATRPRVDSSIGYRGRPAGAAAAGRHRTPGRSTSRGKYRPQYQ